MTVAEFRGRVVKTETCWLFPAMSSTGYGMLNIGDKKYLAHRLAWELAHHKPVPAGMYICHKCDVRNCVRPGHLFVGTAKENMQDAKRKGRMAGVGKWNGARTHCPRGHEYNEQNTRWYEGRRYCRPCGSIRTRDEYRTKHRCVERHTVRDGTRTHCVNGHELKPANVTSCMSRGRREFRCRECRRIAVLKWILKKKRRS